ncbi:hypothetical protein LOTGIDRAFT_236988 [Lottia gigantea]|uniref:Protein aurora borealis n=1 Tax=Lottia gigantea TaxID=225164 RepID=V3ZE95_LOTGI|nr:hypothetical protein LOTGIDRAFT_236988 [Lottia gigantea]ESO82372.1 hypothetical protein LOTGIDRAFT_236988 [Lottia gigantea]
MEVSDSPCPAANQATKLYKPNTVIQTLKFGAMSPGSDNKHHENHSNSLRSQMFHRHISDNLHNEVEHGVMTDIDSPCVSPIGLCDNDNDNVFTISPLVNDLSPILKDKNVGSSSSNGSQHSSKSYSSNLSPCNKQFMDSPYSIYTSCNSSKSRHHSSSPVPTLQSSPGAVLFKTPGREVNPPHSRTPKDNVGSVKKCSSDSNVPDGHIINPFEDGMIDKLNLPAFSPSTFTVLSTPSTDGRAPKPFRWSIDQIAALNPADIDEMPHHQERFISPDRELEERAQKAIDQYFSNHLIVPSPWNSTSKPFTLPRTPQMGMMIVDELKGSIQKELTKKRRTQDVSCQTVLSLPLDFDIGSVLAQYMNHKSEDDVVCEDLSSSSLRRKLFFQGDGNTSFSPVKLGKSDAYQAMQEESPTVSKRQPTPEWERHTPLKTPSSAQFASSPINTNNSCKKYHHLRRTSSTEAEFLASPELSPINRRHSGGRLRTIRSSGEFAPVSSLCTSPIQENFSDQEFPPLPSPNMSPIRKELGASYLPENDECSDESTPHASNPRSYSSKVSQFTLSPQFQTIDNATCTTSISPLALTEATAMETDAFKSCDPITDIPDYSDMEMNSDNAPLPNSTNQDTGYQTASIQLTSLHTNLTSQFSSLPLRTESSIDPHDLGDSFNYSQSNPSSALDLEPESDAGGKSQADSLLSEGKGLDKVKNALNFASSLYPDSLDVSLNPVGSSTPTKGGYTIIKQKLFHNAVGEDIDFKPETQLGSQMAIEIMRRAGEDLAKFSAVQDSH